MGTFTYEKALPILAAHGLVPGPDGFDPADLVALAAARGWAVSTEPVPGRVRRWRAAAMLPPGTNPAGVLVAGSHGHGATEAEALALAVASLLRRAG